MKNKTKKNLRIIMTWIALVLMLIGSLATIIAMIMS